MKLGQYTSIVDMADDKCPKLWSTFVCTVQIGGVQILVGRNDNTPKAPPGGSLDTRVFLTSSMPVIDLLFCSMANP